MLRALGAGMSLVLIFGGCGKPGGREVLANVIFVQGNVIFDSGKGSTHHSQPATPESRLHVGDRLDTSPDAAAALSLIPGIFIQMGGGTEIIIKQMRVEKQGDAMV